MIHLNKLGPYTITNTLVHGRNSWVSDTDPEFVITWCGEFWHIGHRGEAGKCAGYISSSDNTLCFESVKTVSHYVHCIKEWVSAVPSNLMIICHHDQVDRLSGQGPRGQIKDFDHGVGHGAFHGVQQEINHKHQLLQQQDLDIDPRNAPLAEEEEIQAWGNELN